MQFYRNAHIHAWAGVINWSSDAITATLHTSAYSPNLDTDQWVSALTNELSTGGGYTSGGITLSSKTLTYTAANSWGYSRANSTAYAVEYVVRPATGNGYVYRCAAAGTSGSSVPTWGTVVGETTTDGSVTWECVGSGVVAWGAANPQWTSATFGPCRYLVLSDRTPSGSGSQPLIAVHNFVTDQTGQGGAFTDVLNSQGTLLLFTP